VSLWFIYLSTSRLPPTRLFLSATIGYKGNLGTFSQGGAAMSRIVATFAGLLTVAFLIAGPVAYGLHEQNQVRNFRVVKDGVLYRSGLMTLNGLKRLRHDFDIKTVLSLRDSDRQADQAEEKFCEAEGIRFIRLQPRHWEAPAGPAPVEENVVRFRAIMDDPNNYPVLIHCFAGVHRTGAYCAIYRMEKDHWSNADAIRELKESGYVNLDEDLDVLGYLEAYKPTWREDALDATPAIRKRPPAKSKKASSKNERTKAE
jgi:tyrosine-protein phosphatase SIW14